MSVLLVYLNQIVAVELHLSDCSQSIAGLATSIFYQMIPSRLLRQRHAVRHE